MSSTGGQPDTEMPARGRLFGHSKPAGSTPHEARKPLRPPPLLVVRVPVQAPYQNLLRPCERSIPGKRGERGQRAPGRRAQAGGAGLDALPTRCGSRRRTHPEHTHTLRSSAAAPAGHEPGAAPPSSSSPGWAWAAVAYSATVPSGCGSRRELHTYLPRSL